MTSSLVYYGLEPVDYTQSGGSILGIVPATFSIGIFQYACLLHHIQTNNALILFLVPK